MHTLETSLCVEQEDIIHAAFTHKSFSMDTPLDGIKHQERLEFLWDAVLWGVIADILFTNHHDQDESWLTLAKISLVREEYLAHVARQIDLGSLILLWTWEERSWWRDKDSVLSDSLEALIACIYTIWWRKYAYVLVHKYIYIDIQNLTPPTKSWKNQLQEYCQKTFKELPTYIDEPVKIEDNGNILLFWSTVCVWWKTYQTATWPSKKKAQEAAAELTLQNLL